MATRDPFDTMVRIRALIDPLVTAGTLAHHFKGLREIADRIWDTSPVVATWYASREEITKYFGPPTQRGELDVAIQVAAWAATPVAAEETCLDAMDAVENAVDADLNLDYTVNFHIFRNTVTEEGPDTLFLRQTAYLRVQKDWDRNLA